jgi:hypothetical protein
MSLLLRGNLALQVEQCTFVNLPGAGFTRGGGAGIGYHDGLDVGKRWPRPELVTQIGLVTIEKGVVIASYRPAKLRAVQVGVVAIRPRVQPRPRYHPQTLVAPGHIGSRVYGIPRDVTHSTRRVS